MKNFVIFVLLVVVVVLGYFLYRNLSVVQKGGAGQPPPRRIAGAKNRRSDHHKPNPETVITQYCDILVGKNNDICIIPISYLEKMSQSGQDTYALEVRHKDTIIWFGDGGETVEVQPLVPIDCNNGGPDSPGGTNPNLTDSISPKGVLQYGQVTDDSTHDGYCFKTTVYVTPIGGQRTKYDPHMFNGGP